MQKCLDNYNTTFASFVAMLDYHQTQSINSHWVRCPVKELSVESLDKMSPNHMNPSVFALGVGEEAISDTTEHLGLALKVNGELYPVRETAYKTLLDRAKIGGSIWFIYLFVSYNFFINIYSNKFAQIRTGIFWT